MANEAFKLSFSTKFQLEKRKQDDVLIIDNVPIQMAITFKGKRLKMYTGYRIASSKWDEINQRVKKGFSNSKKETWSEINNHLGKLEATIINAFDQFKLKKHIPTLEDIKLTFKEAQGKTELLKDSSFFELFKTFVREQSNENTWSESTIKKMTTVYNTLFEFDSKVSFESFDAKRIQDYLDFLRTKKDYRNSTIAKQLKNVKWFLRWAIRKQHSSNLEFIDFKPKLIGVSSTNDDLIFLNIDECKYLYAFDAKKDYLTRVKDVFLFCCFTGLRFSDVSKLTRADIKTNHIGYSDPYYTTHSEA